MENKLDFARPIDVWWWSTIPEIKLTADFLTDKIWKKDAPKFDKYRFKNHLKVILVNLKVCRDADKNLYLAVSLDKNNYYVPKKLKNIFLKYEHVAYIVNFLTENGYIEYHKGVSFANFKRCSRIKSTAKLIRLFKRYHDTGGKTFRRTLPVFLKDEKKRVTSFDINQPEVKSAIQHTNFINKCLVRHNVRAWVPTVDYADYMREYAKYAGKTKYYRIFNNSSFEQGGRFYGHWSQNIPSKYRKYITIDDKKTVELDYSCLHISILFGLEGRQPPKGDLYQLKGIPSQFRNIVKKSVNIILNASSETKALQAMQNDIFRKLNPVYKLLCPKPKEILEAIRNTYPELSKYFCSNYGVKLQFYDSSIAENILLDFAKDDICCLSIHDSFIVEEQYQDRLSYLMTNYFRDRFGFTPNISVKK